MKLVQGDDPVMFFALKCELSRRLSVTMKVVAKRLAELHR
jgi:hypothetical protein